MRPSLCVCAVHLRRVAGGWKWREALNWIVDGSCVARGWLCLARPGSCVSCASIPADAEEEDHGPWGNRRRSPVTVDTASQPARRLGLAANTFFPPPIPPGRPSRDASHARLDDDDADELER